MTIGDEIRNMTDEELAQFLLWFAKRASLMSRKRLYRGFMDFVTHERNGQYTLEELVGSKKGGD